MTIATGESHRTSLEELYRFHRPVLLVYLRGKLFVDRDLAEDVLQETFLRAWHTPRLLDDPPESCRGWLFTVARNVLVDLIRRRARRPQEALDPQVFELPAKGCESERVTTSLVVRQALARLTPLRREILELIYFHEHSYDEVAELLGIAPGTVRSRAHAALKALRAHLRDESDSVASVSSIVRSRSHEEALPLAS